MRQESVGIGRVLLAAVLLMIVSQVVHTVGAFSAMGYYQDPEYVSVWSKLMMPEPGPPPPEFMWTSLAFAFITGLLFALVYNAVRGGVSGESPAMKGLMFGWLVFVVAGIPAALAMYLTINVPPGLILMWTGQALLIYLVGGLITGAVVRPGAAPTAEAAS